MLNSNAKTAVSAVSAWPKECAGSGLVAGEADHDESNRQGAHRELPRHFVLRHERIQSISANAEEAAALIKQGFRSARDIVDTPREDFVSEHPADDCLTVAEMTYERAQATLIAGEVGHDHGAKKRRS